MFRTRYHPLAEIKNYSSSDVSATIQSVMPHHLHKLNLHLWATFMMFRVCFRVLRILFPFLCTLVLSFVFGGCTGRGVRQWKAQALFWCRVAGNSQWGNLITMLNNSEGIMFFIFHCCRSSELSIVTAQVHQDETRVGFTFTQFLTIKSRLH